MNDPYQVLKVSPNATDEEITKAYKNLAKKYHPDNYIDSELLDLATKKMQEINEAYDQIRKQRREGGNRGSYGNSYSSSYNNNSYAGYGSSSGSTRYHDVRMMIKSGRIADADQILSGVPNADRNAEWYFLKGTILYRKGWTEQAYNHFQQACNMAPNNNEYRAALNQMNSRQNGQFGGYNHTQPHMVGGCSSCDICTALCCADTCCECMGGDCISCC